MMSTMRNLKEQAREAHSKGRSEKACYLLESYCQDVGDDPEGWFMLGIINGEHGKIGEAISSLNRAIRLDAHNPDIHFALGFAYQHQENMDEAARHYQSALELSTDNIAAGINLADIYRQQGDYDASESLYIRILAEHPHELSALTGYANLCQDLGSYDKAAELYQQAVTLQPDAVELYNNLGLLLHEAGRLDDANDVLETALKLDPTYIGALCNKGLVLRDKHDIEGAIKYLEKALAINADAFQVHTNIGQLYELQSDYQKALHHYQVALQLHDNNTTRTNLAIVQDILGDYNEAVSNCEKSLGFTDSLDARLLMSKLKLMQGDFSSGWYHYSFREKGLAKCNPELFDAVETLKISGKRILVKSEQGIGDNIFFLRFAKPLKQLGAHITFIPDKIISSIVTRNKYIDEITGLDSDVKKYDLEIHAGDLPLLAKGSSEKLPEPLAFSPDPALITEISNLLAEKGHPPYIGLTWRAGTKDERRLLYKGIPLNVLARVCSPLQATFISIQRLPSEGETQQLAELIGDEVHDLSHLNDDLERMLALLLLLDEYIGVSNTNMHLRAGVDKPARVLVPNPPEWRWMAEGAVSPWFPGFTVYRQSIAGDWEKAVNSLSADLAGSSLL